MINFMLISNDYENSFTTSETDLLGIVDICWIYLNGGLRLPTYTLGGHKRVPKNGKRCLIFINLSTFKIWIILKREMQNIWNFKHITIFYFAT